MAPSELLKSPWSRTTWNYPGSPLYSSKFLQGQTSPLVTLLVGQQPHQSSFTVHEEHLRAVAFFDQALNAKHFKDRTTKVLELPTESPPIVEAFLVWLLRNTHSYTDLWRSGDPATRRSYRLKVIVLAHRWQVNGFARCGYHLFWKHYMGHKVVDDFLGNMVAAWEELAHLRARFLPVHLVVVKTRFDERYEYNRTRELEGMVSNREFWEDLCVYEKVFQMVLDEDDGKGSLADCVDFLVEKGLDGGRPRCRGIFPRARYEVMKREDVESLDRWFAGVFER